MYCILFCSTVSAVIIVKALLGHIDLASAYLHYYYQSLNDTLLPIIVTIPTTEKEPPEHASNLRQKFDPTLTSDKAGWHRHWHSPMID